MTTRPRPRGHGSRPKARHDEHEHGKAAFDPHVWLDPANAQVMVAAIAAQLEKVDPANAKRYAVNAAALGQGPRLVSRRNWPRNSSR